MMTEITNGLFQTRFENPFGNTVVTAAYFAVRPQENILFYSSAYIEQHFEFMEQNGGVKYQYVNHRDEASEFCDLVDRKFMAPLHCHILEKEAISKKCTVGRTFDSRSRPAKDLEIIPTPGHCPGSTCFLLEGEKNTLFTGDTLYPAHGTWCVSIADGKQEEMINSLSTLMSLDVDLVVPSLFIGDMAYQQFQNPDDFRNTLEICIGRLRAGGIR